VTWPAAEIEVDEALVRSLLDDQHPDLAAMALANCYLIVPEDSGSLEAGATVTILLP